jgi:N4-gp56 family major capsid protein
MKGLTKMAKVSPHSGKTVWWVGVGRVNPVGAALTEGADPTARSTVATRVSGTLAEYGNLVKNSRLFMDVSLDGTKKAIIADLAKDAAKTLDDTVLAKALGGGTALYAASKVHRSDVVKASTATIKDIRKAVRLLQLSSVPRYPDGFYVGLAHPDVIFDLQSDSAWTDFVKYRDTVKLLIVASFCRNADEKWRKFRENLRETMATLSEALFRERATTIIACLNG